MRTSLSILTGLLVLYSVPAMSQCACCSSVGCDNSSGAFATTQVKRGHWLLNVTGRYTSFRPLNQQTLVSDANADTNFAVYNKSYQVTYAFNLTYGISDRFNATVTLPYTSIANIETAMPGSKNSYVLGTSAGISNVKTTLQFALVQAQYNNGWEVVPSAGIIVPTGIHSNIANDGALFDDQFQPGADAWVPVLGLIADKIFTKSKITLRGTANYVFASIDKQGNVDAALWNSEVAAYIPLSGLALLNKKCDSAKSKCCASAHSGFILSAMAGFQAEHIGQDIMVMTDGSKMADLNKGAFRLYAVAGVNATISRTFIIPVTVSIPVYQEWNGYQVHVNYRLSVGLSVLL